jgi:hypothetical protein
MDEDGGGGGGGGNEKGNKISEIWQETKRKCNNVVKSVLGVKKQAQINHGL